MIKLSFCQNDPPIGVSFWQKDSLITHILFELWLITLLWIVSVFLTQTLSNSWDCTWVRESVNLVERSVFSIHKKNPLLMFQGYNCWRKRRINECEGTLLVQCCKRTISWGYSSKWSLEYANALWNWTYHKSIKVSLSNENIFLLQKLNNKNILIRGLLLTLGDLT